MAGRAWRYGLLGAAAAVALAAATGAVLLARFDPNSLKPRIEAAVQQATGRDLGLYGPISLKWSLRPTVELRDVTFANPPGYARPQMATLQRLDLQLAVLPLLIRRFEITRLVLVHPDILLERDAQGHPNWQFAPAGKGASPVTSGPPASTSSAAGGPSTGAKPGTEIAVHDVRIEDGTLAWRNDRTGTTRSLALTALMATSAAPDAPLTLAVDATYNGVAARLNGQVGSLARLQQPDSEAPWPVKLTLASAGATVSVDGALTRPLQGHGYTLALDGTIPDLEAIAPLLPDTRLPPLHDVKLAAKISDSDGPVPHIESAALHLGPADLSSYVPGLSIVSVDIDAPQSNQPVKIAAHASRAGTPVTLVATVGVPATLLAPGGQSAPVPLDLTLQAPGANLAVKGTMAHPETLSGADLAIGAAIQDLSALSALVHRKLPAVTQIALQGHLTDATGGLRQGATLRDMKLTTAYGDLSGTIGVLAGPPQGLTGNLHASRIDADALLAAAGRPVSGPAAGSSGAPAQAGGDAPSPQAGASPGPNHALPAASGAASTASGGTPPAEAGQTDSRGGSATAAAPSPATPQAASGRWLIPDTPIPFGLLRQANADLTLAVDDLKTGGSDYRAIDFHLALQNGKLTVAPLSAELPEGRLDGTLSVDATASAQPVALTLHAPGLEVAPLLAAAGLPGYAAGRMEVYADLHGTGDTPHAIAAGLDGSLGLAIQNGKIDTQLLEHVLGPTLQRANLSGLLSRGGSSDLRCFALRADIRQGVAELRALVLNSSLLSMDGTGSVNLGQETLALRLRPQGRLGGTVIIVPLQVTGPMRSPGVKVNGLGAAEANVGTVAGAVIDHATPLGLLGGLLGGGKLLDPASAESCAGPLAMARGGAAPPAASSSARAQPKPSPAETLLHDLFH